MTVEELIKTLESQPPDAEVIFNGGMYYDAEYDSVDDVSFVPNFKLKERLVNAVILHHPGP